MKILHVITSLKIGGAERALCTLINNLGHRGFTHHVAYFYDGPCNDILRSHNIATYQIHGLLSRYDLQAYLSLKSLVQRLKPDVIHTSLWSASILGRLVGFQLKIPVVSDVHNNCAQQGMIRNFLDRLTARIPFRTIAVADEVKRSYLQHVFDAGQRLIVIKNGIDPDRICAQGFSLPLSRAELGIAQDAFVVGSVGRLEAIKSYDVLIKAFALLSDSARLVLVLVGGGSEAEYLKNLAMELHILPRVIFVGSRDDAYRFYPLFDCFALSSQSEGLSLAILEALCFGLPIITTNKLTTHEVITDGVNGFVVPPNDPVRFAASIKELCNNSLLVDAMKKANYQLVRSNFHIRVTIDQYEQVFRSVFKSSD